MRSVKTLATVSCIQALLIVSLLFSCSYLQSQVLTPKQTLVWAMKVYNGEWNRYIRQTVKPEYTKALIDRKDGDAPIAITNDMLREDLSNDQWESLRAKKEILTELHRIVDITDAALSSGGMPSEETQEELIDLINRLIGD